MLLFELLKKKTYISRFLFDKSIINISTMFFFIVLKIFDIIKLHRIHKFVQLIYLLKIVLKIAIIEICFDNNNDQQYVFQILDY